MTWFDSLKQSVINTFVRINVGQDPKITAKESFDYWSAAGYPIWVVWSLLGDEQRETSFNWLAVGDKTSGGAHGIAQWHDARADAILKGTGIDVRVPKTTHKQQLQALDWEITKGEYRKIRPALMATKDEYDACHVLVHDFERAKQTERDVGIQIGFAQSLQKSHPDWIVTPTD